MPEPDGVVNEFLLGIPVFRDTDSDVLRDERHELLDERDDVLFFFISKGVALLHGDHTPRVGGHPVVERADPGVVRVDDASADGPVELIADVTLVLEVVGDEEDLVKLLDAGCEAEFCSELFECLRVFVHAWLILERFLLVVNYEIIQKIY